jgi:hypothetical protein
MTELNRPFLSASGPSSIPLRSIEISLSSEVGHDMVRLEHCGGNPLLELEMLNANEYRLLMDSSDRKHDLSSVGDGLTAMRVSGEPRLITVPSHVILT